jgi:outer membrane protein OmpA-like peptidoglycan-associated protein/tetratricopeptide (TPR) repeat protein
MRVYFIRLCIFFLAINFSLAQTSALIRKAESNVEKGNLREAISNYKAALANEPGNWKANLGLGLIYSEFLDNYVTAQPYLETAMQKPVRDTAYDLIYALGKCYQYAEDYSRALSFYSRLQNVVDTEDESDFEKVVEKRKADCLFAQANATVTADPNIYFANAGKNINTEMPEYVPVMAGQQDLIFTSKRQDDPKEELNFVDGKYYESMYIAEFTQNRFSKAKRYTVTDKGASTKTYNHHSSVVSVSQDGKILYTLKDSKLYETPLEKRKDKNPDRITYSEDKKNLSTIEDAKRDGMPMEDRMEDRMEKNPERMTLSKFGRYESHAYLTRDGKTLYFTSDVAGGIGGSDLYTRTKTSDGNWGDPVNLGPTINTPANEDSPFLATDGTLYFASEGHPGYGNYDIYKSRLEDGQWQKPENLGPPVNTSAHDIFLVLDSTCSFGYFSSGRLGGLGDMDIYKITYLDKLNKDCQSFDPSAITLSVEDVDSSDFKNKLSLQLAPNYRLLAAEWMVNGEKITNPSASFLEKDYSRSGVFPVTVKVIAGCDTCLSPLIACLDYKNEIKKNTPPLMADLTSSTKSEVAAAMSASGKNKKQNTPPPMADLTSSTKPEVAAAISTSGKNKKPMDNGNTPAEKSLRELLAEELAALGVRSGKLLFDVSKSDLADRSISALKQTLDLCQQHPELGIVLTGYTDVRGESSLNKRLSLERAREVQKYLVSNGLSAKRIVEVRGAGASNFINECGPNVDCPEEKHMQNRRVELTFVRIKN